MHIFQILILAASVFLTCCSTSFPVDATQTFATIGAIVKINQKFEIPVQNARVYIQNRRVTSKLELDKTSTYCSVLMQDLHKKGEPKLTVSPGQFEIIKLRRYNDDTSFPGIFFRSRMRAHDFPKMVIFEVEMRLKSLQQPGVRSLICAKQVMVMGPLFLTGYYPTITEIRNTLGSTTEIATTQ